MLYNKIICTNTNLQYLKTKIQSLSIVYKNNNLSRTRLDNPKLTPSQATCVFKKEGGST